MAMYNYGIGGNEVKKDLNDSIANIPSNRTLLIQKLTDEHIALVEKSLEKKEAEMLEI